MGGPSAWGLGEVLTTPRRKVGLVMKRIPVPRDWAKPSIRPKQWKRNMKFGCS